MQSQRAVWGAPPLKESYTTFEPERWNATDKEWRLESVGHSFDCCFHAPFRGLPGFPKVCQGHPIPERTERQITVGRTDRKERCLLSFPKKLPRPGTCPKTSRRIAAGGLAKLKLEKWQHVKSSSLGSPVKREEADLQLNKGSKLQTPWSYEPALTTGMHAHR